MNLSSESVIAAATALSLIVFWSLLRRKSKYSISHSYLNDSLVGAQCTCGDEMRVHVPQFVLSYEDKEQADRQVHDWIIKHKRSHN